MRKLIFNPFILVVLAASFFSFTTLPNNSETQKTITSSKVVWKGYKVLGSHEGTINLKSGFLSFNDDNLVGGEFIIDVSSITVTDLEGDYKANLEGHLKSGDFFGVETFPTAKLVITNADRTGKNAYEVTGDLTIKETTNAITFDVSVYGNKATANLKIDRTAFDIKYGSANFFDGLKDKAIYDEFDLVVDAEF
ncbi:MAG: YceI family protein [Bacteroidota bacterium]